GPALVRRVVQVIGAVEEVPRGIQHVGDIEVGDRIAVDVDIECDAGRDVRVGCQIIDATDADAKELLVEPAAVGRVEARDAAVASHYQVPAEAPGVQLRAVVLAAAVGDREGGGIDRDAGELGDLQVRVQAAPALVGLAGRVAELEDAAVVAVDEV